MHYFNHIYRLLHSHQQYCFESMLFYLTLRTYTVDRKRISIEITITIDANKHIHTYTTHIHTLICIRFNPRTSNVKAFTQHKQHVFYNKTYIAFFPPSNFLSISTLFYGNITIFSSTHTHTFCMLIAYIHPVCPCKIQSNRLANREQRE